MAEIMAVAVEAARQTGALLMAERDRIASVEEKGDRSLVTNVDCEAERVIRRAIETHFPTHGILGEEGGRRSGEAEYVWVVDPLDGTHNYIRGVPLYGVSIGITRRGRHVAGVIYMPEVDALYTAEVGAGAFLNGSRISVSATDELARCSMSFDSGIKRSPARTLAALAKLGPRVFNIRMFGASTVLLTYLARGSIDFAVEFADQPWDSAAGICLVREAGGTITEPDGAPLGPDSRSYLASNGRIHREVADILATIDSAPQGGERKER